MVAKDLSAELARSAQTDTERHLRGKYGVGYQPFVVVLAGEMRRFSNRPTAVSPILGYAARMRLAGRDPNRRRRAGDPPRPPRAHFVEGLVNGKRVGMVAVPLGPPPLVVGRRDLAPTPPSVATL